MSGELWWERRMVAFDLETTGTDPEHARIVTAALAFCGGGDPTEGHSWIADPGVPIPDEAAEVHGITTERAQAEGRPAGEVVREVVEALAVALAQGIPLVIFNARYDLTTLDREARRHDVAPLQERQLDLLVLDPSVLDKFLHRYRKGSRKLEATCEHYGATLAGAHDAAFDAIAAARLAWCIGAKGRVIRKSDWPAAAAEKAQCEMRWEAVRYDLVALHAFQVVEAAEQARGLREHFREQGQLDDAASVREEWPVVPVPALSASHGKGQP